LGIPPCFNIISKTDEIGKIYFIKYRDVLLHG